MEGFGSISWNNLTLRDCALNQNETQKYSENLSQSLSKSINDEFIAKAKKATKLYHKKKFLKCFKQLELLSTIEGKSQLIFENLTITQIALDGDIGKYLKNIKLSNECITFLRSSENHYQKFGADLSGLINSDSNDDSNNDYELWARRIYNISLVLVKYGVNHSTAIYLLESFLFTHALYDRSPNKANTIIFDNVNSILIAKMLFLLIVIYVEREYKYEASLQLISFYCQYCNKKKLPLDYRIKNLEYRSELLLNGKLPNMTKGEELLFEQNQYLKYHVDFVQKKSFSNLLLTNSSQSNSLVALSLESLKNLEFPLRSYHLCGLALKIRPNEYTLAHNYELLSLLSQTFINLDEIYESVVSESKNPLLWGRFGELRLGYCFQEESLKNSNTIRLLETNQIARIYYKNNFSAVRLLDSGSVRISRFKLPSKCFEMALKAFEKVSDKYNDVIESPQLMMQHSGQQSSLHHHNHNELVQELEGVNFAPHSIKYHLMFDERFLTNFWTHMKLSLGYCYLSAGKHARACEILRPFREFERTDINDAFMILLAHLYSAETCLALNQIKQAYQLLDFKSLFSRFVKCNIHITRQSYSLRSVFAYNLLSFHVSLGLCNKLNERIVTNIRSSNFLKKGSILALSVYEHIKNGNNQHLEEAILQKKLILSTESLVKPRIASVSPLSQEDAVQLMRNGWNKLQVSSLIEDGLIKFGKHSTLSTEQDRATYSSSVCHRRIRS